MRDLALAMMLLLGLSTSVRAAETMCTPLTDERVETLVEHTRVVNELRAGPARKGVVVPPLTTQQVWEQATTTMVDAWEGAQHEDMKRTPWAARTPRQKRLSCKRDQIAPADCPK